jgi:hypothetical protein
VCALECRFRSSREFSAHLRVGQTKILRRKRLIRNYFIKGVLVLVCLTLSSMPTVAQKGKPAGGGGGSACAVVATPTLSTVTASPGLNVGVFGRVGNCGGGRQRFTVTVSAVSSCGEETIIASSVITFNGGETKLISVSYPIAPDTCLGLNTVSVSVYSGGTLLGSQSTVLTIL